MLHSNFISLDFCRVRKCRQQHHHGFNFHSRLYANSHAFANAICKSNPDANRNSRCRSRIRGAAGKSWL
jgi:hypothetical protein